jgi:hypothetical protein
MIDAQTFTSTLRGKWHRRYGVAACPVCQPEARRDQSALTVSDGDGGRLLAHCKKTGCDFTDILAAAGVTGDNYRPTYRKTTPQREAEKRRELEKRAKQAKWYWQEAYPIQGTPAEAYLRSRAITCTLPPTLRFHPSCWHGPTARRYPAMVALIEGAESFAVHRTYLSPDGTGKADLDNSKLMLGGARGGAVRLSAGHSRLAVAEGIETSLSLMCGLLQEPANVWAALSTSGITGLRLPRRASHLTIAPDGDTAGKKAAFDLAERASRLGWRVDLLTPPESRDWNDILKMEAV